MQAVINNYDILCFQLKNDWYPKLDAPFKKLLDGLSAQIKTALSTENKIQAQPKSMLEQIFNLRIKAIKWLASQEDFNYLETIGDVVPQIKALQNNPNLEVLTENLLFALRCNKRVAENLLKNTGSDTGYFLKTARALPEITYDQFLASIVFSIPDEKAAQKIIDWINSSLHIEFALVATDIIYHELPQISAQKIDDLAFLTADAAQEYFALAMELGIIKSTNPHPQPIYIPSLF